jgi:hypothetical protein
MISKIKKIINNFNKWKNIYKTPMPLGRWRPIYDERVNERIDRATEDHCGPCGQLYLDKEKKIRNQFEFQINRQ